MIRSNGTLTQHNAVTHKCAQVHNPLLPSNPVSTLLQSQRGTAVPKRGWTCSSAILTREPDFGALQRRNVKREYASLRWPFEQNRDGWGHTTCAFGSEQWDWTAPRTAVRFPLMSRRPLAYHALPFNCIVPVYTPPKR